MSPSHSASRSEVRWSMTDRGFKHYEAVQTSDGLVRVYESSAADGPHLWVDVDGDTTHLTLNQATQMRDILAPEDARLREVLTVAIERHYQVEQPDPKGWKGGDVCAMCGSSDTGEEDGAAFCRSCGVDDRG